MNTGSSFTEGPAEVVVELSTAEAATGAAKTVITPPDGTPVTIYFPPGARDGMVQTVELPWADPATGTASTRTVAVTVRVLPAGAFPVTAAGAFPQYGPGAFPGQPQPAFPQSAFPQPGFPPSAFTQPGLAAPARRRFGTRARIVAVALGVVLVGGLCLVPTLFRGSDARTASGSGTVGATPTASATVTRPTEEAVPTTPPLDPAAFQAALDEGDKQLTAAVDTLRRATTPRAVAGAANALAETIRVQASALSGLTAPAAVSAAHSGLVAALSSLEDELASVSSAADSQTVCTGASAGALLSRAGAAATLRTAITGLAAADPGAKYRFGSFLPAVSKDQNRRKANGSYLTRTTGGSGQLKVDNGNTEDTVVNLVKAGTKKPAVSLYIRGQKKVTTGRIKDGTYQIFVSSGADWDGKRFTRDCTFSRFDSDFAFTTTSRQYTIWEISLQPVVGGNASSSDVDPDSFPS